MEQKEDMSACCCECCHCKKIFMLVVLILLSFIAGIMVGNCQSQYPYGMYYAPQIVPSHAKVKHLHRGAVQKPTNMDSSSVEQPFPNAQLGGYIIEIDQAQ